MNKELVTKVNTDVGVAAPQGIKKYQIAYRQFLPIDFQTNPGQVG